MSKINKQKITNLIKAIIVIASFALTVLILEKVLLLKSEDGIEQIQSYYKQPKNSVDALFVGSSHIFCHVNTGVLWDEYGISGYDLAGAEQPFWNSYYYIKEALKTQTPKVIVLDVSTPGIRPIDNQPENWLITNTFGIKPNRNRYDAIKASALEQSFFKLLTPLKSIHGRYNELNENDFTDYKNSINYKGFDPRETCVPMEAPDISKVTEKDSISEKEDKYLRKIIEYCSTNNIPLLLITSPYGVTAKEQKKFNTIYAIADEYGVPYIDFNTRYEEMGLDFSTDMAEVLHLNRSGNEKFTIYLGECLKNEYALPDHRGDEKYISWEKDALYQRQDTNAYKLNAACEAGDINKCIEYLTDNDNYVFFMSVPKNYEITEANEDTLNKLKSLCPANTVLTAGTIGIYSNVNCFYSSDNDNARGSYSDGNRRFLITKETNEEVSVQLKCNSMLTDDSMSDYKTFDLSDKEPEIIIYDSCLDEIITNIRF